MAGLPLLWRVKTITGSAKHQPALLSRTPATTAKARCRHCCSQEPAGTAIQKSSPDVGTAPTVDKDHHWFGQVSVGAALSTYAGNTCGGKMPSVVKSSTGWRGSPTAPVQGHDCARTLAWVIIPVPIYQVPFLVQHTGGTYSAACMRYAAACLRVAQRTSRMYMEGTFTAQSYRTRHGWFLLYAGSNCLRTDSYSCTVSSYCTTSTGDCLY